VVPIIGITVAAQSHQFPLNFSRSPQASGTFSENSEETEFKME
jgi:hypothetical protein